MSTPSASPPLVTPTTLPFEMKLGVVTVTSPLIDQLRLAVMALENRVTKLENRLGQLEK